MKARLESAHRSQIQGQEVEKERSVRLGRQGHHLALLVLSGVVVDPDRKSTRLNSSHSQISYAVFCLKQKHTFPVTYSGGGLMKDNEITFSPTTPAQFAVDSHSIVGQASAMLAESAEGPCDRPRSGCG